MRILLNCISSESNFEQGLIYTCVGRLLHCAQRRNLLEWLFVQFYTKRQDTIMNVYLFPFYRVKINKNLNTLYTCV